MVESGASTYLQASSINNVFMAGESLHSRSFSSGQTNSSPMTPTNRQRSMEDIEETLCYYNCFICMVAYFCHHLSEDNYVDLSDLYVDLSDLYVDLSLIHLLENES